MVILWVILISVIIALGIGCFRLGKKIEKDPEKLSKWEKGIIFLYVIFVGCFIFPISSEVEVFDFQKLCLIICVYLVVGQTFAKIYGAAKEKFILIVTMSLTAVGLALRYMIEYGEVSNTYNFTLINVGSYILIIPVFIVFIYRLRIEELVKKELEPRSNEDSK